MKSRINSTIKLPNACPEPNAQPQSHVINSPNSSSSCKKHATPKTTKAIKNNHYPTTLGKLLVQHSKSIVEELKSPNSKKSPIKTPKLNQINSKLQKEISPMDAFIKQQDHVNSLMEQWIQLKIDETPTVEKLKCIEITNDLTEKITQLLNLHASFYGKLNKVMELATECESESS